MGTYDKKVNQLKDLMKRKYKSVYDKSKEIDIDISSMTYLPKPDVFDVMYAEHMSVILDRVNKIIDDNKDKLKNPTCATCIHLHDQEWAKRYGKVCCSIWQVCDHYINPNRKHNSAIVLPKGTIRRLTGRDLKWEDDPISLKSVIEGLPHVDIEFYKQKIINFVKWI
jgi:hypothetical protein